MTDKKPKILAADNDASFLKIISEWFEFQGFQIQVTEKSAEVMDILSKDRFDAIILDVIMGPPNGIELLEQIKNDPKSKDIPVFILSQMGEEDHQKKALALGAVEYLVKSNFRLRDLTDKINHAIHGD
jgi:CheY-like chemotaxis protein